MQSLLAWKCVIIIIDYPHPIHGVQNRVTLKLIVLGHCSVAYSAVDGCILGLVWQW